MKEIHYVKKTNKYTYTLTDGILHGLLLSCFIWGFIYFKSKIEMFYFTNNSSQEYYHHREPLSINFLVLASTLIISSLLARLVVENINKNERNCMYWLKITTIMFVIFYSITLFIEVVLITFGDCLSCGLPYSLHSSINIKLWLLLLLLFAIFTPIYSYLNRIVMQSHWSWNQLPA